MSSTKRFAIGSFSLLVFIGLAIGSYVYTQNYKLQQAVQKAEEEGKRGFWALAYENLDKYRFKLVKNEKDCNLLLNIYANFRKAERLDWAAQACLESGVESYGMYLSLAIAQELYGRDQDALLLLGQMAKKFDKETETYRRMAVIFFRNKEDAKGGEASYQAALRTENAQIKLETVSTLLRLNRGIDAMTIALPLRDVQTDNPEVKLIIARALIAGRDSTGGVPQINEAKSLMTKLDAERVKQIEHDYADVFNAK